MANFSGITKGNSFMRLPYKGMFYYLFYDNNFAIDCTEKAKPIRHIAKNWR